MRTEIKRLVQIGVGGVNVVLITAVGAYGMQLLRKTWLAVTFAGVVMCAYLVCPKKLNAAQ